MIILDHTLFVDGFNDAIVGTTDDGRVIYSKVLMIEELVVDGETSLEDAMIHCEYNIWNAYVGEYTPIFINDFDSDFDEINEHINA